MIGLDTYAVSPELNHLAQTGVATVWQIEQTHSRRMTDGLMLLLLQPDEPFVLPLLNRHHALAIAAYRQLTDNWDQDDAIAPDNQTIASAGQLVLALSVTGQSVYHTAPGPNGEIMINLRNGDKSAELLLYPGGRNKFVRISPAESPQQGPLTSDALRETVKWLNR